MESGRKVDEKSMVMHSTKPLGLKLGKKFHSTESWTDLASDGSEDWVAANQKLYAK